MQVTSKLINKILESYPDAPKPVDIEMKDNVILNYRKFLKGDGLDAISARVRKTNYGEIDAEIKVSNGYDSKTIFSCYSKDKDKLKELEAINTAITKVMRKMSKELK